MDVQYGEDRITSQSSPSRPESRKIPVTAELLTQLDEAAVNLEMEFSRLVERLIPILGADPGTVAYPDKPTYDGMSEVNQRIAQCGNKLFGLTRFMNDTFNRVQL